MPNVTINFLMQISSWLCADLEWVNQSGSTQLQSEAEQRGAHAQWDCTEERCPLPADSAIHGLQPWQTELPLCTRSCWRGRAQHAPFPVPADALQLLILRDGASARLPQETLHQLRQQPPEE